MDTWQEMAGNLCSFYSMLNPARPDAKTSPTGRWHITMYQAFIEFCDQIYYEGYALETLNDFPKKFWFEFREFAKGHTAL